MNEREEAEIRNWAKFCRQCVCRGLHALENLPKMPGPDYWVRAIDDAQSGVFWAMDWWFAEAKRQRVCGGWGDLRNRFRSEAPSALAEAARNLLNKIHGVEILMLGFSSGEPEDPPIPARPRSEWEPEVDALTRDYESFLAELDRIEDRRGGDG